MIVKVFIQNEAGSKKKNYHNERTRQFRPSWVRLRQRRISANIQSVGFGDGSLNGD